MNTIKKKLYDDIIADSNIINGKEYRELVCTISQVASDMVSKTLGPYGATTVIDEGTGFTYPSKDGWTCLNKMQFTDPTYNTIYTMLKKISFNSVTTVGDGTTTAMVVANNFMQEIYNNFIPMIEQKTGFRQADFIETMNYVYETIVDKLTKNKNIKHIDIDGDYSDIYRVAYIATNGNHEFSKLIQEIYQKTNNPNIQITMDKLPKTEYEIQNGYKFESRVLNYPAYINNDSGSIDYKNHPCRIVIFDHNVNFQHHEKIIGALNGIALRDKVEIIILAPYFDDIISSWIDSSVQRMIQNHQRPNIMLVQIPTVMDIHRKTLGDLSVLTNAQIFDEPKVKAFNILLHNQTHKDDEKISDPMLSLEQYSFESPEEVIHRCLGKVHSILINKSEAFLQDYESIVDKVRYNTIIQDAEEDYTSSKKKALKIIGGTLDKEFLFKQMRYIKLKGSTGMIRVGGLSDIQQRCDKDTLDDAILACRSAFENGYVRGMNLEILMILNNMKNHISDRIYESDIIDMLYNAFFNASLQVIMNKYPDNNEKRRIVLNNDIVISENNSISNMAFNLCNYEILSTAISDEHNYDYNLRNETMHQDGSWEVINSTATDIEILRAVVNVLTTVITSNQFLSVTHRFDPKVHSERRLENQMSEEAQLVQNKVNAAIDALVSNKNFSIISDMIQLITSKYTAKESNQKIPYINLVECDNNSVTESEISNRAADGPFELCFKTKQDKINMIPFEIRMRVSRNVYAKPSSESDKIDVISIGKKIQNYSKRSIYTKWYEVVYTDDNGNTVIGYIF